MKSASQETVWKLLYKEFRSVYPSLGKEAVGFSPIDESAIIVHLLGGKQMLYDGVQHRAKIIAG